MIYFDNRNLNDTMKLGKNKNYKGEVMVDDLGLIVLPSFKERGHEVSDYIAELRDEKNKNYIIDIDSPRFANGEGKVKINETVRNKDIYILADIGNYSCTYNLYGEKHHMSPDEHYMDIVRTISAISGKAKSITVFAPLMYASRQHRKKARESLDCAMSLRYLEYLGVHNVITIDVHDPNIQNVMPTKSFDTIPPIYSVLKVFAEKEADEIGKDKMIVISPDTGAIERCTMYASVLGLELGLFYKRRDYTRVVNGKNPILKHDYIGSDVKGKNILIIDDMIASGESVIDIIKQLKERGCAKTYVITSFAFFTEGIEKFNKLYEEGLLTKVYSTNASYIAEDVRKAPWFEEVSLVKLIGKIIDTLNKGDSISRFIDGTEKIKKLSDNVIKNI